MERVRRRFERWRRTRVPGRSPIPASLWAAAVAMARQHGVYATSRLLRLDYAVLKRRLGAAGSPRESGVTRQATRACPTLIELPYTPQLGSPCVIELPSRCGAPVRIQVPWTTVSDLVAFARGLWSDGSARP